MTDDVNMTTDTEGTTGADPRGPLRGTTTKAPGSVSKEELRAEARRRRAALDRHTRLSRDDRRTEHALSRLMWTHSIALYLSRPDEPGTIDLADTLVAMGKKVLVPVLSDCHGHGLHHPAWAWYDGMGLRTGLWQIPEPNGPNLPAEAISQVEIVLCSALMVDRRGNRLGIGGGWYDRVLGLRSEGAPVWALIDDDELVDELPRDAWDAGVDAALTPSGLHLLGE